ncbi:MAG: mechanosensitive ion channel domain-containing protein [Patescibacteria group bacterium]
MNLQEIDIQNLIQISLPYIVNILSGLGVLVIGWIITDILTRKLKFYLVKSLDDTVAVIIANFSWVVLKVVLFVVSLNTLGVETTSLAALIGASGLSIGLALSGSLNNIASVVLILLFKPIEVDDYIDTPNGNGTVKEIGMFMTKLQKPDETFMFIPNSLITGNEITNYSRNKKRRMEFQVGVGYENDIEKVTNLIAKHLKKLDYVIDEDKATIGVVELADSSVTIQCFYYIKAKDYLHALAFI